MNLLSRLKNPFPKEQAVPTLTLRQLTPEDIALYERLCNAQWQEVESKILAANSCIKKLLYPLVRDPEVLPILESITCCFPHEPFNLPDRQLRNGTYEKWANLLTQFLDKAQINKEIGFWEYASGGVGSRGELSCQIRDEHILVLEYHPYDWSSNFQQTENLVIKPSKGQD